MEADNKPKATSWWRATLFGMSALFAAEIFVAVLFLILFQIFKADPSISHFFDDSTIGSNFIAYALSSSLLLFIINWFLKRHGSSLRQLDFKKFKVWRAIGLILLAGLMLFVAIAVVFALIKYAIPSVNLSQAQDIIFTKASSTPDIVLAVVALIIVAPVAEETIFRGFMLPAVAKRFGWLTASIITALLFGLVHGQLNVGIVTFVMGLLLAWLYKKTGSLWPGILFHSFKNLIAVLIIFK